MNFRQISKSWAKLVFFSCLMLFCLKGKSQTVAVADSFFTDTIIIHPRFPTEYDTVRVIAVKQIPWPGAKVFDFLSRSNDTFRISTCVGYSPAGSFMYYSVKHELGMLQAGTYTITAKITNGDSISCFQKNLTPLVRNFTVSPHVGFDNNNVVNTQIQAYPIPANNLQTLIIKIESAQNLKITLHDLAGQKVIQVFNGQSVQGRQEFEVDISQLPNGIYFYHIKAGEEVRHLKVIKQ